MEGGAEHRLQGPSTRAVVDRDGDLAVGTNGPSNEVDDVREVFFGHLSEWDATHGLAREQVHTSLRPHLHGPARNCETRDVIDLASESGSKLVVEHPELRTRELVWGASSSSAQAPERIANVSLGHAVASNAPQPFLR